MVVCDSFKSIEGTEFHSLGIRVKNSCLDEFVEVKRCIILEDVADLVPWSLNLTYFLMSKSLEGDFRFLTHNIRSLSSKTYMRGKMPNAFSLDL